jgi:hypothetical protein
MAIDPARILRASKLRLGRLRAQGVPAILLGAAGIVLAVGASRALRAAIPTLPATLREAKMMLEAARLDARSLRP